jgi:TonB family protein
MRTFISFTIALVIHIATFILCFGSAKDKSESLPVKTPNKFQVIGLSEFKKPNKKSKHSSSSRIDSSQLDEKMATSKSNQLANASNAGSSTLETTNFAIDNNSYERPVYPARARSRGIEGRVKIKVDFNKEGKVVNIIILESSKHQILDDAVKNAVVHWKNNSQKEISIEKTFEFRLADKLAE